MCVLLHDASHDVEYTLMPRACRIDIGDLLHIVFISRLTWFKQKVNGANNLQPRPECGSPSHITWRSVHSLWCGWANSQHVCSPQAYIQHIYTVRSTTPYLFKWFLSEQSSTLAFIFEKTHDVHTWKIWRALVSDQDQNPRGYLIIIAVSTSNNSSTVSIRPDKCLVCVMCFCVWLKKKRSFAIWFCEDVRHGFMQMRL